MPLRLVSLVRLLSLAAYVAVSTSAALWHDAAAHNCHAAGDRGQAHHCHAGHGHHHHPGHESPAPEPCSQSDDCAACRLLSNLATVSLWQPQLEAEQLVAEAVAASSAAAFAKPQFLLHSRAPPIRA